LQIIGPICAFDRGRVPDFNTVVRARGEPLNSGPQNLALRKPKKSHVWCQYIDRWLLRYHKARVWQTDRQKGHSKSSL